MATASSVVVPEFTSLGVNRVVNALDWGPNGLIAYCGHHVICLYDPEAAEVVATLTGHSGQVNCVKWLPSTVQVAGSALLLSGAADYTIRVWAFLGPQHPAPWTCIALLQGHESPVTSLALQVVGQDLLLASTSADACVRLWQCSLHGKQQQQQQGTQPQRADQDACCDWQQQEELLQAFFGAAAWKQQPPVVVSRQIQHCVALATLPADPDYVIMATGGTDCTVRLYVRQSCDSNSSRRSSLSHSSDQQLLGDSGSGSRPCPEFRLQCQLRGHENWVKGVAFLQVQEPGEAEGQPNGVSLLLASAGQDRYGRIWCISTDPQRSSTTDADVAGVAGSGCRGSGSEAVMRQLLTRYAPRPHLAAGRHIYWVTLEALLIGHEDWLHSVGWRHTPTTAAAATAATAAAAAEGLSTSSSSSWQHRRDVTLLTTSQDRSMMLWRFDDTHQLWLSQASLGDAGASCLGFYGGAFNPSGDQLVAHGFTGALHIWRLTSDNGSSGSSDRRLWVPHHALGGHYGSVQDLCWGGDGGCLQSVGGDQTARLFTSLKGHWFELARTQVHGHDFSCLASIPCPQGSSGGSSGSSSRSDVEQLPPACLLYVSGSEEKVLRVFEAPQAFMESLTAVRSLQSPAAAAATAAAFSAAAQETGSSNATGPATCRQSRALGASVAALGLSNKAVYMEEDDAAGLCNNEAGSSSTGHAVMGAEAYNEGPDFVPCAVPAAVSGPPLEEHLAQNTLWPEVRKLYGHGNDVFCVCSSPSGKLIASACKAQSSTAAAVWLWEVGSWRSLTQLPGHTLTVTQLEFSQDGRYLLSCSRDRSICVWRVPERFSIPYSQPPPQAAAAAEAAQVETAVGVDGNGDTAGGREGGPGHDTVTEEFVLVCRQKAAHSRIIWGISWAHDGSFFATGSRDQTVKLWARPQREQQQRPLAVLPTFPACVTAVALSPRHVARAASIASSSSSQQHQQQAQEHLLAVGMEDGNIEVWCIDVQQQQQRGELVPLIDVEGDVHVACQRLWVSEAWNRHAAAVKRLRWAPACVPWLCDGSRGLRLASCGEDHSVRILNLKL